MLVKFVETKSTVRVKKCSKNKLIAILIVSYPGVGMCGTQEPMGSGVPGGTHPNVKNMGSGGFRVPTKFFFVPTPGRIIQISHTVFVI